MWLVVCLILTCLIIFFLFSETTAKPTDTALSVKRRTNDENDARTIITARLATFDDNKTTSDDDDDMGLIGKDVVERLDAFERELERERRGRPNVQQLAIMRRDIDSLLERMNELERTTERLSTDQVSLAADVSLATTSDTPTDLWTRRISFAWTDLAPGGSSAAVTPMNDYNTLLHPFLADDVDVLAVHGLSMRDKRFSSSARRVDGVDEFRPVLKYRSQYLLLAARSFDDGQVVCSGLCFNVNLNFKPEPFNDDGNKWRLYQEKNLRALVIHGTLFDERRVAFGVVYPLIDDSTVSSSVDDGTRRDAELLTKRVLTDAGERTRVFLLGDWTTTGSSFRELTKTLRSVHHYDDVNSEIVRDHDDDDDAYTTDDNSITNIRGDAFRYNVHVLAVGGGAVIDFRTHQTASNSIFVRTVLTLDEPARRRKRCVRYGGGRLHGKTVS